MLRVMKSMKFPSEEEKRPVKFRQFENIQDAISQLGSEEILLAFLNAAILDHDRKQLRYYDATEQRAQIIHYENTGTFISGE